MGLLGFPGGSRRLTPGNGLPLLFAVALENVGGRALIRGGRVLVGRAALSVRHLIIGGYVYLKHHIIGFTPMLKVDDIKYKSLHVNLHGLPKLALLSRSAASCRQFRSPNKKGITFL